MKIYFLVLASIFIILNESKAEVFRFDFPEPSTKEIERIELWATNYHIHRAEERKTGFPLYGTNNMPITGNISAVDWCEGALEGTVLFIARDKSKTLFNFADKEGNPQVDCLDVMKRRGFREAWTPESKKIRYSRSQGPFGEGAGDNMLIPYRSIAVDPKVIELGTVIFIPQARGVSVVLPGGNSTVHDGYFFAADVGSNIKDCQIDMFLGHIKKTPFKYLDRSSKLKPFKAYIVHDSKLKKYLKEIHKIKNG